MGILGGLFGLLGGGAKMGMQYAYDKKIMDLQQQYAERNAEIGFNYNEQSADNAYDRQLDFWNKETAYNQEQLLNKNVYEKQAMDRQNPYQTQLDALKKAGMSPGLALGGGAGASYGTVMESPGATSAPQGRGSGDFASPRPSGTSVDPLGSSLQFLSFQKDQEIKDATVREILSREELNEAHAENLRGESKDIYPARVLLMESSAKLNEELGDNARARTQNTNLDTAIRSITQLDEADIKRYSAQELKAKAEAAEKNLELLALDIRGRQFEVGNQPNTYEVAMQEKAAGVAHMYALADAARSGIELNDENMRLISQQIDIGLIELAKRAKDLNWYEADKIHEYVKTLMGPVTAFIYGKAKGKSDNPPSPAYDPFAGSASSTQGGPMIYK